MTPSPRALSWFHYYVVSMRARRILRETDVIHNCAFAFNGVALAGLQWRAHGDPE